MKIIYSEFPPDYNNYNFPYQVLCQKESSDQLENIYGQGFLPFRNNQDIFYLSRSSRSIVDKYELSSENKRIINKTENFSFEIISNKDFEYSPKIQKTCKEWSKSKGWKISTVSIKKLFTGSYFNLALTAKLDSTHAGYSVIHQEASFLHWAYVFIDPEFDKSGLAIRMGLEVIKYAKETGAKYVYLGTCYGNNNYKRNYPGFEYFEGPGWSSNMEKLKLLNERTQGYSFKEEKYQNILNCEKETNE
jgi:hypothetical protein